MDPAIDPKVEKQSIYDIYRACRLCGAGAGYKMPIIQNVVDLDDRDVQLKEKILDCVQIEVHQDDKMPPLICELCVDKINDFYEFFDMCKQTNVRTRRRLGLPLQSNTRGVANDDCILGMTEAIYVDSDDNGDAKNKKSQAQNKIKVKKPSELKRYSPNVKPASPVSKDSKSKSKGKNEPSRPSRTRISIDSHITIDDEDDVIGPRTTRTKFKREPTPPRPRLSRSSKDDSYFSPQVPKIGPKSILKKEKDVKIIIKKEDQPMLVPRLKRMDKEPPAAETPPKKVKIAPKPVTLQPKPSPHSTPKPSPHSTPKPLPRLAPKPTPKSPPQPKSVKTPSTPKAPVAPAPQSTHCPVCNTKLKTPQAYTNHMKMHHVSFTNPRHACNACREWFATAEEAQSHHKDHKEMPTPYTCRQCFADFNTEDEYAKHFGRKLCIPIYELSDIKCDECWHLFPTQLLYNEHKCGGEAGRLGGKCYNCSKSYWLLRDLLRHEMTCSWKKKKVSDIDVDEDVLILLKPAQVRIARCDSLLKNPVNGHYDVSMVPPDYGYDSEFVYPFYFSKCTLDGMVSIDPTIKEELSKPEYHHWDSDSENEMPDALFAKKKELEPLRTLALKTIFSHKFLGKIPKKIKQLNDKTVFDSLFNDNDYDVKKNIDNIIDNLALDDEPNQSESNVNGVSEVDSVNDTSSKTDLDKPSDKEEQINVSATNDKVDTVKETEVNETKTVNGDGVDQGLSNESAGNDNVSASNDNGSVGNDKVSVNNDKEIKDKEAAEDKKLMDELDAQIENNSSNVKMGFKVKSKSKIAGDSVKDSSMDLDTVSDGELDFD